MEKNLRMHCPGCRSIKILNKKIKFNTFTHFKFKIFKFKNSKINYCQKCGLIFKTKHSLKNKKSVFLEKNYEKNNQVSKFDLSRNNKSSIIADFIFKFIKKKTVNNILDVGCFNGELIFHLDKIFDYKKILGIDIIKNLPISSNPNIEFSNIKFNDIDNKFDIICFSHSIIYFDNIAKIFNKLQSITHENSLVFVFIPDIVLRPLHILLSDQYTYLNDYSFNYLLKKNNFYLTNQRKFIKFNDKVFVFKKKKISNYQPIFKKIHIDFFFSYMKKIENKLYKYKNNNNLFVFGTTIEAAFITSILKERVSYYVDEDLNKVNKNFYQKKIIHPSKLINENTILMILVNKKLFKRLKRTYKGNFILL